MKILAKPTSNFMLLLNNNEVLHPHRPSVLTHTEFLAAQITSGKIKVLSGEEGLVDEVTDMDLKVLWDEPGSDKVALVKDFLKKYTPKKAEAK